MFSKQIKGSDGYTYHPGVKYGIAKEDDRFVSIRGNPGNYNKFSKSDIDKITYYESIPYEIRASMLKGW
jgi:hypothetical protein